MHAAMLHEVPVLVVRQWVRDGLTDTGLGCTRPEAAVAEGAISGRRELHSTEKHHARGASTHGVRRGALPEHRGVLGGGDGDVHDPRRYLYSGMRVLRCEDGAAARGRQG